MSVDLELGTFFTQCGVVRSVLGMRRNTYFFSYTKIGIVYLQLKTVLACHTLLFVYGITCFEHTNKSLVRCGPIARWIIVNIKLDIYIYKEYWEFSFENNHV